MVYAQVRNHDAVYGDHHIFVCLNRHHILGDPRDMLVVKTKNGICGWYGQIILTVGKYFPLSTARQFVNIEFIIELKNRLFGMLVQGEGNDTTYGENVKTEELKKLESWPKIKMVIDQAMNDFKILDPSCTVELQDTGEALIIVVDGVPEFQIDADFIQ